MESRALGIGLVKAEKFDVCRLCMIENEYCLSVFLANDVSISSLGEVIRDLLNLEVSKGDGLPGTACGPCVEKLMEFRKFKEMCMHSANELRRHVPTVGGDLKLRCPVESQGVAVGLMEGGGGISCMNMEDESPVPNEACDPLAYDNLCLVKDEGVPMQLLSEVSSIYQSYSVDCESRVPVVGNELLHDPLSLKNETDTEEVYPRDPLGDYDDCPEEDTAEGECNEDSAVCSESIPFVVGEQGAVKEESEFPELVDKGGSQSNDGYEGYSSVTGCRYSLLSDPLAAMGVVDCCSNKMNCFPEKMVNMQKKNVKHNDSIKKSSQGNDRAKSASNHVQEELYHQVEKTSHDTEYICIYCNKIYSDRNSLALHKKGHVEGKMFAITLPKRECPQRVSPKPLVKDRRNVESVILKNSDISVTQRRPSDKYENSTFMESFGCDEFVSELNDSRAVLSHTGTPRDKVEYSCDACGRGFLKKRELVKHVKIHAGLNPFNCLLCGKKFKLKSSLMKHQAIHADDGQLKCGLLGKEFNTKRFLQKHAVSDTEVKPIKCDVCGKSFKFRSKLKTHSVIHTGVRPFNCNVCGKMFSQISNLNKHKSIHTGVKPYKCDVCGKNFSRSGALKNHSILHTGMKPFKCNLCEKTFTRKSHAKSHSLIHIGTKPFQCELCGKMFSTSSNLKSHSIIHTGVKPFMCNVCGKMYTERGSLKKHAVIHTGVRPFKCDVCGKTFTKKSNLKKHSVVHTGVGPLKCDVCGNMFSRISDLRSHSFVHHGVKPFKCALCGKMFSSSFSLNCHSLIHTGVKPFNCNVCGKMFSQRSNLKKHLIIHTGVKPFKCNVCGRMFTEKGSLKRHSKIHTVVKPLKGEEFKSISDFHGHLTHDDQNTSK